MYSNQNKLVMSEQPTTTQNPESRSYTQENLNEMRKKVHDFYKKEIGFLKTEAEYERLQAEIEESKLRKIVAIQRQAYVYAQNEQAMHEMEQQEKITQQENLIAEEKLKTPLSDTQTMNTEIKTSEGKQPRKLKTE